MVYQKHRFLDPDRATIKIRFALFRGGLGRGAGRKIAQNAFFHGKRHDNKISKVKIVLSRNFVVMAQAPTLEGYFQGYFRGGGCIKFGPVLKEVLLRSFLEGSL